LPDADIQALDRRIQSMADAYTLLSQNHWKGVDLAELVRRQLAPTASDVNATIWGPPVILTAPATQALAMVLHELVTNAAKYGALSTPHGRVEVNWHRGPHNDAANLSIVWREIGGPTVAASPDCYGVRIIRELIPHEFGGSVDLAFASEGVCCKIDIPSKVCPARRSRGLTEKSPRCYSPAPTRWLNETARIHHAARRPTGAQQAMLPLHQRRRREEASA